MIILVDLSSVFYRHYHACGSGQFAYELTLESIIGCIGTGARVIVCGEGGKLIRSEIDPNYKKNRPDKAPDLIESLNEVIAELKTWKMIDFVFSSGHEADDVISTIVTQVAGREEIQLWSSDKDLTTLLSDTVTMIVNGKLFGPAECLEKFGVRPNQIRDFLAICGDASDNIKGCPGIGAKGAASLLQQFGTLENIRAATDEELQLGKKTLAKFRAWDPSLAIKLVSLFCNAPINIEEILPTESTIDMADMTKIVTERSRGPLKIVAYGPDGIGKTRFGAFSPKPIFLCAENGLSAPDLKSTPAFPAPDNWKDVIDALTFLTTSQHEHKTLVVDSLDWLHQHARAEICRRENMSPSQFEDYGRGEKFTFELWVQLTRALDALQEKRGMHVIMLAHSTMETFQNPQGEDFVRYQLALSKKAAERWKQWPDFLLFMSQEMFTKKNKDDKTHKGIIGDYRIFTTRSAAYDAKNRINLPAEIPYETENPWRSFADAVKEIHKVSSPQPNNAPKPQDSKQETAPAA